MGVPHLTRYLRPYATPTIFQNDNIPGCDGQTTYVDGPAFAYHIYNVCVATRGTSQSPFRADPSYSEIKDRALTWLDQLSRDMGLRFDQFFFDGLLPAAKRPVRISRLERYHKQLCIFNARTYEGVPNATAATSEDRSRIRRPISPASADNALPPLPFLVPAVMEVLLDHPHYKHCIHVVPGEADFYCAKQEDPIIFTCDSDLLVYDLGDNGSVVFLNDLEEVVSDDGKPSLKGLVYKPRMIAERLGIKSIQDLAYELSKDHSATFNKALARAKEHTDVFRNSRPYQMWQSEYSLDKDCEAAFYSTIVRHHPNKLALQTALERLDPRVSECIMQYGDDSRDVEPTFYCPFLIDDPFRASPWDSEFPLRRLAYSLPQLALPKERRPKCICEFRRRGQGQRSEEVELYTMMSTVDECRKLLKIFQDTRTTISANSTGVDVTDEDFWRAFGLDQVLGWYTTSNKNRPTISCFKGLVINQRPQKISWSQIHLLAQFHAVLYSARILKQYAEITHKISGGTHTVLAKPLNRVIKVLDTLPSIDALFVAFKDMPLDPQASHKWEAIIETIHTYRGVGEHKMPTGQEDTLGAENGKRKRAESRVKTTVQSLNQLSNNIFNVLSPDC